jgi:integrase/recombinase XerD
MFNEQYSIIRTHKAPFSGLGVTIIQSFTEYLHDTGYSKGIRERLPAIVREFILRQRIAAIASVRQRQVKEFYAYLQTRPLKRTGGALSEATIRYYVYALNTFFGWLETTGQIQYNPISGIRFRRPQYNSREPLSAAEINELFKAASTPKETALLHLYYSCGLRRSEGVKLNTGDIHFTARLLYVREGKGCKRRVVPLTATVAQALENYYRQQRSGPLPVPKGSYLYRQIEKQAFLLNLRGGRMSGLSCNKLLKQMAATAGIDRAVTLHHLRHSIATHLLQGGMSLEYVRDFLGHGYLETTQLYAKANMKQLKIF